MEKILSSQWDKHPVFHAERHCISLDSVQWLMEKSFDITVLNLDIVMLRNWKGLRMRVRNFLALKRLSFVLRGCLLKYLEEIGIMCRCPKRNEYRKGLAN